MDFSACRERARARDEQRGYSYDYKRVAIAYAIEGVVITTSLWGAWRFAHLYGHDSVHIQLMLLMPVAYAVVEAARVPLALATRACGSRTVRVLAMLGVLCSTGVTTQSLAQLGGFLFQGRLLDVTQARADLQAATATQTTVAQRIAAADAEVAARRAQLAESTGRAQAAAAELGKLPGDQCTQTAGVTRDGRAWKGQSCRSDPRIAALQGGLRLATAARDADDQRVQQALVARNVLDRTAADRAVADAEGAWRTAVMHSQAHWLTAILFGIEPGKTTDDEVSRLLRLIILVPALLAAGTSTLIALTAVNKTKPKLIPFAPDGAEYLLDPIYQTVLDEAIERIQDQHRADASKLGVPA